MKTLKKILDGLKDAFVKASHGDHTGRPSINALCMKVTKAIQEDPRFDTDKHGQPEGSPGDVEPYCFDCTVPDDKGRMFAIINTDEGKCVKHGFMFDGENVTLDPGAPEETECTQVYAASKENYLGFVKAADSAEADADEDDSTPEDKSDEAKMASRKAHKLSAKAHKSGKDEAHAEAKTAHEEASDAHSAAMVAHAKGGNTDEANDHAKAMRAHDACADGHCKKDSEAVKASSADYVGKFVKAATPEPPLEVPKGIVKCHETTMEFDSALPTSDIMWMPTGQHTITASYDDKPARVCVVCDENGFKAVRASFSRIMERNENRPPFGDINHKEVEAAFWPKEFSFHDDGIYCKAEWTELGLKCVRGKTFRSFSPAFSCDADWVKAVDNGNGVLVFPEGVRGSASNPARVTGVSPKSVGSLTNWPAFKAISPVRASQADPQPATKPAEQQPKQKEPMKIKFVKASSCGKYAAGTEHDMTPELAQPFVLAGEAAAPAIADRVIQLEAERVRQGETNTALVNQAIVRAQERGALPKNAADGKRHADTEAAFVKATGYLKNGVPVSDVCDIIETMPVKATTPGKPGLFVRATHADDTQPGNRISVGNESVEEACDGILKAYEPMTAPVKGSMGLVRAGMFDEAIEKSRFIANKFNAVIKPILDKGGDFALKDMVKAGDTTDPNGQLGTIATGILLMRDLGFLKAKLIPLMIGTTDLSAEPVKFNQQIITRYKTPPPVLTFKKGIGYTLNANDTVRTTSTVSTTDVAINMQQNKGVCVKFDNTLLASTARALFAEQQAMQFYSLAKAINQHYIQTLIASAWTPKTEAGGNLNPPQFNANQFNVPSLVAVKNKMTLAQIPDEGRKVLLHSFFHDILLQDSNILTASVIKAALQAQTNPTLTTFGNTELPELFGLDIHESQLFSDVPYQDANWQPTVFGFAGTQASALFVSRVPNDYTEAFKDIPATAAIQVVTEPDSNLSMLFSKWVDNAAKETNAECAVMYQAAQGHPGQGFLLKCQAGTAQN